MSILLKRKRCCGHSVEMCMCFDNFGHFFRNGTEAIFGQFYNQSEEIVGTLL